MKAEIITIGDELLIGQVVDTNSAWMAQRLNEQGIVLHQITSVHDDRQHILKALDEAFSRADIVLTTGGLGPTKDDITKHVMCEYFGTTLVEDPCVREHIHTLYKDRPDVLNRLTTTQWLVPESATILPNRVGSAPIMVFEKEAKGERLEVKGEGQNSKFLIQNSKFLIALPGVPHEMKIAMTEQVLPFLRARNKEQGTKTDMKRLLLILAIGNALCVWAQQKPSRVPAYRGIIERVQPNGDTIYVRLHGDERRHWMTLEDGTTLVKENKKGYVCYAKKKKNGTIVATCKKVKQSK